LVERAEGGAGRGLGVAVGGEEVLDGGVEAEAQVAEALDEG
jgi:hypothetical protein